MKASKVTFSIWDFRNIILLFFAFLYVFPVFLKYLPIPLDRVFQLIGFGLCILSPIIFKKAILTRLTFSFMRVQFIIVVIIFLAIFGRTTGLDTYLFKQSIDLYFHLFSSLFIVLLCIWRFGKEFTFVKVLDLIVFVFVIQSIISLLFFISSELFNLYLSFLKEETNQGMLIRTNVITKRFIGFGTAFFSGVVKYGCAILILSILPYCKGSYFYKNRFAFFLVTAIITISGIMMGRFFFLAIFLAILLAITVDKKNLFRFVYLGLPLLFIISLLFYIAGVQLLGAERFEIVFKFIFEFWLNYIDTGTLSTSSSDKTLSMYLFPDNLKTWVWGDGRMFNNEGGYYMGTDVGYIRLLFYFGSIATIIYFIIQFFLHRVLIKYTKDTPIKKMIFFMFLWVCVFHIKGLTTTYEFLVLFLASLNAERILEKH